MSISKFTVSRDDSVYEAWPDLALTVGGKLICVFMECASHADRTNSSVVMCTSEDRGRTWSEKRPISELSQKDWNFNCPSIKRMRDDSLIVLCDRTDRSQGTEYGPNNAIYLWRGNSEGTRWEEAVVLPIGGIVPDRLVELICGRLIIAAHIKNIETNRAAQYMWYSDDKGKTWSDRVLIAEDARYSLCEASLLELDDETLVAFMRENSGTGNDCMKAISYDHGNTWEGVYNVPIPGCHNPVSGILSDGTIMITHRYMHGGRGWLGSWTQNVFAAFTDIESAKATQRNGQRMRIMPLDYDRSPKSDLGYTGWVQFEDGEIYVVTYIVDDAPTAQIRGYSFYKSDVIF